MALRPETIERATWLDFYSLYRLAGFTPYGAVENLVKGGDFIQGSQQELAAAATMSTAEGRAIADNVANGMIAASPLVAAIPVAGTIIGAVLAGVGALMKGVLALFTFECDEHGCLSPESYYRRAIGGSNPPYGAVNRTKDGHCYFMGYKCALIRYLHDGMVKDGIDISNPESPDSQGRILGVSGIFGGSSAGANEVWRKNPQAAPSGIAAGNKREPWKSSPSSWYGRSWRVNKILLWLQDTADCRTLKCLHEMITNTQGAMGESAFAQQRRRGSRWYASIYMMQQDLWAIGKKVGKERFAQLLRNAGMTSTASRVLKYDEQWLRKAPTKDKPFPWWAALRKLELRNLIKMMKVMQKEMRPILLQEELKAIVLKKAVEPIQLLPMDPQAERLVHATNFAIAVAKATTTKKSPEAVYFESQPAIKQAVIIKNLVAKGEYQSAKAFANLSPQAMRLLRSQDPTFSVEKKEIIVRPPPPEEAKAIPAWPFIAGGAALAVIIGSIVIYKVIRKED